MITIDRIRKLLKEQEEAGYETERLAINATDIAALAIQQSEMLERYRKALEEIKSAKVVVKNLLDPEISKIEDHYNKSMVDLIEIAEQALETN